MNSLVGVISKLPTARVRLLDTRASASKLVATMRSPAITTSAEAGGTRPERMSSGFFAIRTCDKTCPPFCARPVISKVEDAFPSTCAAMPTMAETVVTPVPPTPVNTIERGRSKFIGSGSGIFVASNTGRSRSRRGLCAPSMVIKLGQKPSTQRVS